MQKHLIFVLVTVALSFVPSLRAEIKFSALTTIGYTGLDRQSTINTMFRGDDPFNPVRITMFAESWINPRLGVFLEFLWDQGKSMSGSDTKPRVNGAYAVAKVTTRSDALVLKLGMIPSPFGAWAPRTYADRNPLVGLPLMYHYRTPISGSALATGPAGVIERKENYDYGLPLIYDACWDNGIEALGFSPGGKFEYHLAVTKSAISNPRAYLNDGAQVIARVGFRPVIGLKFGISAAAGSYLGQGATGVPEGEKLRSVNQKALAADLAYSVAHTEIFAEIMRNLWENPNLEDDQGVTAGYLELRQTLFPGFYLAGRFDRLVYDRLSGPEGPFHWGYDITRLESGGGYYVTKDALVKAVWQHNDYAVEDDENVDLLSVQLVLTF